MKKARKIFSKVYDKYVEKIYRFIFLKVNSSEIAEDLCSETFLKGWQAFKASQNPRTDKKEIENLPAFLYQIARNLVVDYYREKGRTQIVSTDFVPIIDPKTNLEKESLIRSDFDIIRGALVSLKENYQEVVIWHYVDDLSISEIAKILNKSEGAVRVMLHRAIKALKNELDGV